VVEQCFYTAKVGSSKLSRGTNNARIAQLVEHLFEAQGVGGSIPSPGTREDMCL
jgi:hypothetical protein